ncbi:E3 ubiquitin-protein ligase RBBP6-like [Haliotis rubra]|uniref:E3 ubiquitin-protein ligase RBBP6-like n=1 Tax=Haliotis rubra TaxID=36100 RepID=UPI001EE596CA|nr:E3 ubiquitin-protein ligase RBBP6-like [Haliotis rubra]
MAKTNHLPLIDMKPCKLLHRGHVPYPVIVRTKLRPSGVYKVAYRWETIYVGSSSNIIKDLRKQFSGNGKQDLIEFLLNLPEEELEMVSVYWLDKTIHVHNCGKSYLECITYLQGKKPKFNDIQPILCSMSTASVAVVNADSKTFTHENGQSQDVSVRPSNGTEERKKVFRRRLSSLDKHTAPDFSLMSRKRPAEEDREKSQFHTDSKKMKTDQHVEHSMHHCLTKSPKDTPICRSETANLYFSTTVPSTNMNLKMQNIDTPEMSLSNIPRSPVMTKSSYKQRSQSIRGASVDMSSNHENLTTRELPQQFCISPRSPEFEERIQHDTVGCMAGRTNIRKDKNDNIPISTVSKENPPACPTTLQVDKNFQKKLQLQPAGDKCESPSEETFRHYLTAPQEHSQKTNPSFQASSERNEQTHTVSSTQSLHTAIQPRRALRSPEKDPGTNEHSDEKHKESTTCARGGNDPERNIPPVSSTSPSGLAETLSVLTSHAVSEPEPDTTRSRTGVPTRDISKLLEIMLKAAPAKPGSVGWSIKPSGSRNLVTKNETTSLPYKSPGANSVGMLVCEPIVSSTQTCPSNQSSQTKVPCKASGEQRLQTNVPRKASGEQRSQTKVPNIASGELRSQTKVPNIASGEPRSQTKVTNKASGEQRLQTNVPRKASGEPRSQRNVPNKASGEQRSQTNVPRKASGEQRSQTNVPNKASGEQRSQTNVPRKASGEQRLQTNVSRKASGEQRLQTNVPRKASGEQRLQTNVPNKASGEQRSQTNVPRKASGEQRLQTNVSRKASGEQRLQTNVSRKASGEQRSQTNVPNKASGEPRSQTNVPNKASGEPRSQTNVPNIASGRPRTQTNVPNIASGERDTAFGQKVPNIASVLRETFPKLRQRQKFQT